MKVLEPFNLEEYLKNPSLQIVNREGNPARIICTDKKGNDYPVIALIAEDDGKEYVDHFTEDGSYAKGEINSRDILFSVEKKEGWVNLYKNLLNNITVDSVVYHKKELAESCKKFDNYIGTVRIEWEE